MKENAILLFSLMCNTISSFFTHEASLRSQKWKGKGTFFITFDFEECDVLLIYFPNNYLSTNA